MELTTLNGRREKMRRPVMMFGMGILLVLVAAGLAVAVTKTCGNTLPCQGTANDDVLYERIGKNQDRIRGRDGRDVIDANTFSPERDVLNGERGRDTCYVSKGDSTKSCNVIRRATFTAGTSDVSRDLSKEAFGR
jgi:hypothetical protein